MTPPPAQAELETLAERALSYLDGEGRATAWWERRAESTPAGLAGREDVRVELALADAVVETTQVDEAGLRAAAAAAARLAGESASALPDPAPGRVHDGYDPSAGSLAALAEAVAGLAGAPQALWTTAAAKIAIASTRGVRAYEQRSFAALRLSGAGVTVTAAATGLGGLDAEALAAELDELLGEDEPVLVEPGEYPVVLAPWAVASVLERLPALGDRLGTRVVAPNINLSDSPRFPGTLPRSYDVHGAPKQPLPLIQDGVAHRVAGAPPEHLVLVGGGAADVAELASAIEDGLLIAELSGDGAARGVRRISGGELGPPARDVRVAVDPISTLASTEALTARQRLVPVGDWRSARTIGATVAPALRARAGVRVVG